MSARIAAWAVALTVPELALATANSADPGRVESVLPSSLLLQMTLGLAVVLAAAVGLTWFLRRYALPRSGAIQVLGGLPLGSRERLLLIEVDKVRLLIGVTSSQIQALHVFPPPTMTPSFRVMSDALPMESPNDHIES